jgi:hypothetical protein
VPVTLRTTVAQIADRFLKWIKDNRAEATYDWYLNHCNRFVSHVGVKMKVHELGPTTSQNGWRRSTGRRCIRMGPVGPYAVPSIGHASKG